MGNLKESRIRVKTADTCAEIDALLNDEGCCLEEALEACEERWPRRWNPITLATVRAMRGRVVVDHVVGICDFVEVSVRSMLGELDRHSEEWTEGDAEREAAWEAKRAATRELPKSERSGTDQAIDRVVARNPGKWCARAIADARSVFAEGHFRINEDVEMYLDTAEDTYREEDAHLVIDHKMARAAGGAR